ncbi:MAG: low molecular weight protein arginine phosphatase [Armatimonadetes bacterium]|nr:low molecular weight protein arginine phosphatase [Armatimonadota bacterium]
MMQILFVCTGNTCRSPMAEGLGRELSVEWGVLARSVRWSSAGLAATPEMPADPSAVNVMLAEGIDISDHHTQVLSLHLIKEADLILTMTTYQKEEIVARYPFVQSRVFALKEYAHQAAFAAREFSEENVPDNPLVREILEMEPNAPLDMDIHDPVGGSREVYQSCMQEIRAAVESLLETVDPRRGRGGLTE